MKELMDTLAKLSGALVLFILVFSIIFDWGYFNSIGHDFQRIASATDYLTNAIEWVPTFSIIFFIAVISALIIARAKKWPPEYTDTSSDITSFKTDATFIIFEIMVLLGVGISLILLPSYVNTSYYFLSLLLWPYFLKYIFSHENAPKIRGLPVNLAVLAGPMILVLAYSIGEDSGQRALHGNGDIYVLERKDDGTSSNIFILKGFEKGVLIRDVVKRDVELVRWDYVKSLKRRVFDKSPNSKLCNWIGWPCVAPPQVLPSP
jgi:hypothetical protein